MNIIKKTYLTIDPANLGLRTAIRGTLGIVISFAVSNKLSPGLGFVGGILALLSSILINDPTLKEQKQTLLMVIPIALVSLMPSISLMHHHEWQLVFFLVFTFIAIYLRKFGPRWLSLGFLSFMSYFTPIFFPLKIELIPQVTVAVCFSIGICYLLRFYIFPDRAEKVVKSYIDAFNFEYSELVLKLDQGKAVSFQKLNELTVTIESYLNQGAGQSLKSRAESLQMALFEREIELQFENKRDHSPIAFNQLIEKEILTDAKIVAPASPGGMPLTTKMAIQATIATAIASYIGIMVSPQRWYWAPMTSFVVFVGSSRGETLLRASFRVIGTIIGLVLGLMINPLITGHHTLEWNLIICCLFLGIFATRFYFGFWTASIFTFMITILFDVLGQMNTGLLVIRFEETLVGAVVGTLSSAIVLPISTKKLAQIAMAKVLKAQVKVLELLPLDRDNKESKRELVKRIRNMDAEFAYLKTASAPFIGKITFMKRGEVPILVHDVIVLGHYVRHLATNKTNHGPEIKERIEKMVENLESSTQSITPQLHEILDISKNLLHPNNKPV